jgi:hypothetical protein
MSRWTGPFSQFLIFVAVGWLIWPAPAAAAGRAVDRLERFRPAGPFPSSTPPLVTRGQFNGYTNYWHSVFWTWLRHGNIYLISQPDVPRSIAQSKVDIAEELGLPGLVMSEGFLDAILRGPLTELEDPGPAALETALDRGDVLAWVRPADELGRRLLALAPDITSWRNDLRSHQAKAREFRDVPAFELRDGSRRLLVIAADGADGRGRFKDLLTSLRDVLGRCDLHRGWFGTGTLLHSVTCHPGHPLEVIAQGLAQGNDWFTFSGYMDYLLQPQLPEWLAKVGLDVVTDVGTGKATHSLGTVAYGCRDWEGLKIQDMPTEEEWLRFVKDRGGFVFRPVYEPACDTFNYDGYIAVDGTQRTIDGEDRPFILQTGLLGEEAPACMVLFTEKGRPFTREAMWEAILSRRAVGVLPRGRMMGPAPLRQALQLLLLDRIFLEGYFGDRVELEATVEGHALHVRAANLRNEPLEGELTVRRAPELRGNGSSEKVVLPPGGERSFRFPIEPALAAMGRTNPVRVDLTWKGGRKRTLAILDLPPAVSVHRLLYGQAPEVLYPVTVHNFTNGTPYPVEVEVYERDGSRAPVFSSSQSGSAAPGGHQEHIFRLPLKPGAYTVRVTALGATNETQLGVGAPAGRATAVETDLDGDGLNEVRLENDHVRVTLLAIGARVIEYVVKERGDNVLFKLWPKKEDTDKRPFRERGFYPYGGFEDFLGQASIETHKVYDVEILKREGPFVRVKMSADYYGNRLEKVFTLDGGSPLVEVRFALEFRNPELNMLGPQPILELGARHGPEDVFVVPARGGNREVRMRMEEYFGEVFFLREGWNAGRDTVEDVSFVGAFPVTEPEFLHMWMNHPSNGESHHYYAEFQPWVPIAQKTVRYFSYYLWGAGGPWENGLEELRRRNLITTR